MARLKRGFDRFGIVEAVNSPPHYQYNKRRLRLRCDCPGSRGRMEAMLSVYTMALLPDVWMNFLVLVS